VCYAAGIVALLLYCSAQASMPRRRASHSQLFQQAFTLARDALGQQVLVLVQDVLEGWRGWTVRLATCLLLLGLSFGVGVGLSLWLISHVIPAAGVC
jgi:hypothetical protein